jgi:hypothetical protein
MNPKTEILVKYSELAGNYHLKKIFEYLNTLQKTAITNMFGATPYLYGGRNWVQKQVDYLDIEEDENVEKLLDMADEIKNVIITGALKRQEGKETNDFLRSIERRVQQESKDILKIWMDFKGKVLKESVIVEAKYDKKDAVNFLFRRISENDLEDEFYENYKYYSEGHSRPGNTYSSFKRRFLDYMMDGIHGFLVDGFMEDSNMYEAVRDLIEEMYEDRIEDLWFELTDGGY